MSALRHLTGSTALVLAAALTPTEAWGCTGSSAIIHSAAPVDPDGRLVVARVDVEWADPRLLYGPGVTARVVRVIHGDYDGELMVLRSEETSCSEPFANGSSGLIVGIPLRLEDGVLVVEALEVNRASGYRVPDGYRVPQSYLSIVRAREAARASKPQ